MLEIEFIINEVSPEKPNEVLTSIYLSDDTEVHFKPVIMGEMLDKLGRKYFLSSVNFPFHEN